MKSACVECERERCREYNRKNRSVREKYAEENRENLAKWRMGYARENAEKINAQKRALYAANPDVHRERRRTYYDKNREKSVSSYHAWKEKNAAHLKLYYLENRHKFAHRSAIRRSKKLLATPPWLSEQDLGEIASKYREARTLREQTGEKYHVDHIVPLQGESVCGLHVPWNLQVITALRNLQKNNRFIEV